MVRVKHREDMGESTSPQRNQLEEMVLRDKNDGREMETDNGLEAGLLHLPVTFPILSLQMAQTLRCQQVTVHFQPVMSVCLLFVHLLV